VMSTEGTYEDATHEVDGDEPIEVGDLLDDPRTDAEALCLCALLWCTADTASDVSDLLRSTDFDRGVYGELFEVITAQVGIGAPHDPASIASRLTQSGRTGGHRGAHLRRVAAARVSTRACSARPGGQSTTEGGFSWPGRTRPRRSLVPGQAEHEHAFHLLAEAVNTLHDRLVFDYGDRLRFEQLSHAMTVSGSVQGPRFTPARSCTTPPSPGTGSPRRWRRAG